MIIEIKNRFTNAVLCSFEAENFKECVEKEIKNGANLRVADLSVANLRGADLSVSDLSGADLSVADLSGEKIAISPILISGLMWSICISESYLEIGCQRHTHEEWGNFSDDEIASMDYRAIEFWKQNKSWILSACKAHRKESLAYRKANPESEVKNEQL